MLLDCWWKKCCFDVKWMSNVVGTCLSISLSVSLLLGLGATETANADEAPFTIPDGFEVQKVADDLLAHDCFAMTLDALGRPIVSGPGYIRTLIDDNNDGTYDRSIQWSSLPKQGAQGLWSEGRALYWVGDGGLWKSEDTNGDLVSDGSPKKVLELPTGGEHDAHAIRRGPDGYWYLIAGNFAANIAKMLNDPMSPVVNPRCGTIWRISPDFSKRSVWAHGMRNCYDFDFMPDGQIVTYDSDCEREATFPWYRPTRAFILGPGSDAGWCGSAWKDDDNRITMPLVISRLGRGSPTGVAVYQHNAFPRKYHDAAFVLDWTFGRVIAVYPSSNVSEDKRIANQIPAEVFMQPSGTAGFAPTDICVCPDGSLLVCVGGRGTSGALYRVTATPASLTPAPTTAADTTNNTSDPASTSETYSGQSKPENMFAAAIAAKSINSDNAKSLQAILDTPCPWESWGEAKWRPILTPVLAELLMRVASEDIRLTGDKELIARTKQRCAQLLTRVGAKLPPNQVAKMIQSKSQSTRAAGWWVLGRGNVTLQPKETNFFVGQSATDYSSPDIEIARWEGHIGPSDERLRWECFGLKKWNCSTANSPTVADTPAASNTRRTWLWALSRSATSPSVPAQAKKSDSNSLDQLAARLLFGQKPSGIDIPLLEALSRWIPNRKSSMNPREQIEFLTLLQASLGDRRHTMPAQSENPADALDGYRGMYTNRMQESVRLTWARWALYLAREAENSGLVMVHAEATRTMAMFEPNDSESLTYLIDQITEASHPTSDIHMLCCIANCGAKRSEGDSQRIAAALAGIVRKVKSRGLYTDNQWQNRLQQLIAVLLKQDSQLGAAFVGLSIPCCAEDLTLLSAFPADIQSSARSKMRRYLVSAPAAEWSVPILRYAAQTGLDEPLSNAVRTASTETSLRSVCIDLLAMAPKEQDYELFLSAIESADRNEWSIGWKGISSIAIKDAKREFNALAPIVSTMLSVGNALPRAAILTRARAVANKLQLKNIPPSDVWKDWNEFLRNNLSEDVIAKLDQPKSNADWPTMVRTANGLKGDATRGQLLFQTKCGLCHGGQSALGPALSGVTKRFSRDDLSKAIFEPSRDISDRYKSIRVLTGDGEIFTGMIVYNAADGITLQTADGTMVRVNQDNIEEKVYSTESLMPTGLLDDKSPQDIADLFSYLGGL